MPDARRLIQVTKDVFPGLAIALAFGALSATAFAQGPRILTLQDAIERAKTQNLGARIDDVRTREAEMRIGQARAGWLPRIDFVESWQRGNQPVFVFGSLLAQRRFTEANFAIDALNHPDSVDNFRHALMVQQSVFDAGATSAAVRSAELSRDVAAIGQERALQDLAVATTSAYGLVLRLQAEERAAAAGVQAAEEDLRRVRLRQETGLVTDADVLAVQVHLAAMSEQRLRISAEATIARMQLNDIMGAPIEENSLLQMPQTAPASGGLEADEAEAINARAEVRASALGEALARANQQAVRASFLPQVAVQSGWEWNGGTFGSRSGSWTVGTEVRLNIFRGLADRARRAEATQALSRALLERERAENAVRLDVRAARARLEAAVARERVGEASVARARESQRITRDRYENGLADVTELLRAAQAVFQTEAQDIAARVDVMVQSATLQRALGR
ncbi:MAG: TolC family protein [Vicinamibacterales bacterium]